MMGRISRQSAELHQRFQTVRRVNDLIRRHELKETLLDEVAGMLLDKSIFCGAIVVLENREGKVELVRAVNFRENRSFIQETFLRMYPTVCFELARREEEAVFQSVAEHTCRNCPVLPHMPPIEGSLNGKIVYQDFHYGYLVAFLNREARIQPAITLFTDALKDIGYAVGMWEHETRLKRQILAMEKANRDHLQFFSMLGHELKNPLNGIIGITSLLNDRELDEETRESIDLIQVSSQILLDLLNDILEYNRIEVGQFRLHPRPVNISREMEGFQRIIQERARLKEIQVTFFNKIGDGERLCDWTRLRQVLLNLISNALKFTPSKGNIEVHACAAGNNYLCFSVVDDGVGIDLETHGDLFEPYRQAHGDNSHEAGGLGLGLAICRMIVEKCGGHIRVSSEPGKGATFTFSIEAPPASSN